MWAPCTPRSAPTQSPQGWINTQRVLFGNQQIILQCLPALGTAPHVLVDGRLWRHTVGGKHNIGLVLHNGGAFSIDEGRPIPGWIGETLRN